MSVSHCPYANQSNSNAAVRVHTVEPATTSTQAPAREQLRRGAPAKPGAQVPTTFDVPAVTVGKVTSPTVVVAHVISVDAATPASVSTPGPAFRPLRRHNPYACTSG
jgi:hypothetical protein